VTRDLGPSDELRFSAQCMVCSKEGGNKGKDLKDWCAQRFTGKPHRTAGDRGRAGGRVL
jgi:hypothetical protein